MLSFILVAFLMGCTSVPEPIFRVGTNQWIGYELLYLARHLNEFNGSPIRLVELTSADEVSHGLRSGVLEAAALTLDEVIRLMDTGLDLRVILVLKGCCVGNTPDRVKFHQQILFHWRKRLV